MLLGNYSVLNRNPLRYRGGGTATPEVNHGPNFFRGGARKNRQYVDQTTAANEQFSLPYGSYPPYMTLLPQRGGDLAARRSGDFGVSPSATGGLGMPGDGNADISITTNTPAGQLVTTVAPGGAPATFGINTNAPLLTASLNGTGSSTIGFSVADALLGALGGMTTNATFGIDGALTSHAIGIMSGTTAEAGVTVDNVVNGVWNAILTNYPTSGSAGNTLALAGSGGVDYNALATAVWAYATRTLTSGTPPTEAQIAEAVMTYAVESGWTTEELLRVFAAVLAGKVSGAGTGTETFRDINDTKNRVTATVDSNGNRSNITLDPN